MFIYFIIDSQTFFYHYLDFDGGDIIAFLIVINY